MIKKVTTSLVSLFLFQTIFSQTDFELAKRAFEKYRYNEVIQILSKNTKFENLSKKDKLEANYILGESYRKEENFDLAQKYLEVAKDIDDEHIKSLVSLGSVYAKKNQWQKAMKEFTNAEKEDKKSPLVPLGLANVYVESDSLDKAIQYFTKARELSENLPEIFIGLGDCYFKQNVYSLALSNYSEARTLNPANPQILIKTGLVYTKMKKGKEAAAVLKEAVDLDPTNTQVLLDLGKMYYRSGIYKESAVYYKKYLDLKPNDFEILNRYAKSLFETRMYSDALPVYLKISTISKSVDFQKQIALCYIELDNPQKAIESYSAIPHDSMGYRDYIKKGKSYLKLQDTTSAVSSYRLAYEKDQNSSEVSGEMAAIFLAQKNFEDAAIEYSRILKNEPKNFSAHFYGGYSNFMLEKFEDAKYNFTQVVELRPDYNPGKIFLARVYQAQDSFATAKLIFNSILNAIDTMKTTDSIQVVKNTTTKIDVYNALAIIEYKQQNFIGSINELLKAITLEPKDIKNKNEGMHLFLAQMYNVSRIDKNMNPKIKEQMKKKAIDEYKFVLKINPNNATAKKELSELNK